MLLRIRGAMPGAIEPALALQAYACIPEKTASGAFLVVAQINEPLDAAVERIPRPWGRADTK